MRTFGLQPALYNQIVQLSQQNKLSGVDPGVLASIVYTEGRTPGLPSYGGQPPYVQVTNSDGTFQGWYDLQPGQNYVNANGQVFTTTPTVMDNDSTAAFDYQTQAAAAAISGYQAKGQDLQQALQTFTTSSNAYNHYVQNGGIGPVPQSSLSPQGSGQGGRIDPRRLLGSQS